MMRSDSDKRMASVDPESAELVFVKDHVTIHPTQLASERISGRLKLIKQGSCLFMVTTIHVFVSCLLLQIWSLKELQIYSNKLNG